MREYSAAVKRLTLGYILAIFVACVVLTVPVIFVVNFQARSSIRTIRGQEEPTIIIRGTPEAEQLQQRFIVNARENRQQVLWTVLAVDVALLSIGAVASYYFARRTLRPLEDAHKAQQRFTADASHELRTPLATMQTELEVALKANKNNQGLRKAIRQSLDEIRGLSSLTDRLLQLAKTDDSEPETTLIDLNDFLQENLGKLEKKYNLKIKSNIEIPVTLRANEALFRQLLTIIMDNAVKHTGDKAPSIQVAAKKADGNVILEVTDKGIGIPEADVPRVFERMYRGANVSSNGHGLGLALAKSIASAHGWELTLSSKLGKGTTVKITAPIETEQS